MHRLGQLVILATGILMASCGGDPPGNPQDDHRIAETVKVESQKMIDATVNGQYETIVEMTHPRALRGMDKDKAVKQIKDAMDRVKQMGLTYKVTEIGEPTVVKCNRDYFAFVSYTMLITGSGKEVTSKSGVVGVSKDEGKTWKFVGINTGGEDEIRRILPDLPRELKIPKEEKTIKDIR